MKLVVVDPPLHSHCGSGGTFHLPIRPGTDIDLLHGIANLLMKWGYIDSLFIDECTRGFLRVCGSIPAV